jgi:hypothetical protein
LLKSYYRDLRNRRIDSLGGWPDWHSDLNFFNDYVTFPGSSPGYEMCLKHLFLICLTREGCKEGPSGNEWENYSRVSGESGGSLVQVVRSNYTAWLSFLFFILVLGVCSLGLTWGAFPFSSLFGNSSTSSSNCLSSQDTLWTLIIFFKLITVFTICI